MKCTKCNGGYVYIPSDGYENSKTFRCNWCHGSGELGVLGKVFLTQELQKRRHAELENIKRGLKKIDEIQKELDLLEDNANEKDIVVDCKYCRGTGRESYGGPTHRGDCVFCFGKGKVWKSDQP